MTIKDEILAELRKMTPFPEIRTKFRACLKRLTLRLMDHFVDKKGFRVAEIPIIL